MTSSGGSAPRYRAPASSASSTDHTTRTSSSFRCTSWYRGRSGSPLRDHQSLREPSRRAGMFEFVKVFLHVSPEEQRDRLLAPGRSDEALEDSTRAILTSGCDGTTTARRIGRRSSGATPWPRRGIVPADRKWATQLGDFPAARGTAGGHGSAVAARRLRRVDARARSA